MRKILVLMMAFMMSAGVSAYTPWKKGAFETKKYRNLLVEMGYGKKEVDQKLKEVFNDVFYGLETLL